MSDIKGLIQASTGSLTKEFNIITNNLSNVSTAGYKRRCNSFSKVLAAQQSNGEENSRYSEITQSEIDFSQGNLTKTERPLDVALYGKGFMILETPDGPLYTRNGMLTLNEEGQVVDMQGRSVAGENGVISIPKGVSVSDIHISNDGTISANGMQIGKLKLVDFKDNESRLKPVGMHCFAAPEEIDYEEAENLSVRQGYQEASNVQIVEELTDMIMVQRLYSANMKFLSSSKDASKKLLSVAMG